MKVLQRYLAGEIIRSVLFVLIAFLSLFAFFDLISELQAVGRGGYKLQHAFVYILLGMPGYAYELIPIAALIGTIYVLAQMASRSEFTIMRISSMSTAMAAGILAKIGLIFVVATFVFGEFISPKASELAEKLKLQAQGTSVSQEFRSGLWAKDVLRENGISGKPVGSRFLNVRDINTNGQLQHLRIYEFDLDFRMTALIEASHGDYQGNNVWRLADVSETRFPAPTAQGSLTDVATGLITRTVPTMDMVSEITPTILSVLFADPDRMSAADLAAYIRHLEENKQRSERYAIAFWKKIFYPFAVFVMMALALPFAYLHFRAGGVSLKIFTGIMIGVSFQLVNNLFSHLGMLNTWPPFTTAVLPSLLYLLAALGSLWWVERH
ncbi:MAG: LPS export ABC transporter permease LptG [Burkholderiaceae bacterium]